MQIKYIFFYIFLQLQNKETIGPNNKMGYNKPVTKLFVQRNTLKIKNTAYRKI